ncbi:right-handed parallel beta-helix repeat-containing protein [Pseudonocardia saturnea]
MSLLPDECAAVRAREGLRGEMTQTMTVPVADGPARRSRGWRLAVLGGIAAVLAVALTVFLATSTALAASHLVTTTVDAPDAAPGDGVCASAAGECTLRAAIQEANTTIVADQVVVPAGTYTLTVAPDGANLAENGDLDITRALTVTGAGRVATVVEAAGLDRVLETHDTAGNVGLVGLTLTGGATGEAGGGLANGSTGTVRLTDVAVTRSSATEAGGGVATGGENGPGRLELVDSVVAGNTTEAEGGGVHVGSGSLTLTGTEVSGNTARGGGGVYNAGEVSATGVPSRVTVTGSTITGNTVLASGGGVANDAEGQLTITGSTLSGNTAHGDGGAIHSAAKGSFTITGGTVAENLANGAGGGVYTGGERAAVVDGVAFRDNVAGGTVIDETGAPVTGDGGGGGLASAGGPLTVRNATFEGNTAVGEGGGALLGNLGSVQVSDTVVRDNRSSAGGGGIENAANRVTLTRVEVTGNVAVADGGGIENNGSGAFTLDRSTIARNTAENGGGLANAADGTVKVVASTIWDNRATAGGSDDAGLGGGVYGLGDAGATYENTTITGNYAQVRGGGLYIDADADVRVTQTTISGNSAPAASGVGGEITSVNFPVQPSPSVLFRNSIVAGNLLSPSCNFALGSQGGNLEDGSSCHLAGPRDRTNAPSAGLDAIADNGGTTLTMHPQDGAFAVDGGISPCSTVDQRGVSRPKNALCDIGAVESEGPFAPADDIAPETTFGSGPVQDTENTSLFTFSGTDNATAPAELLYECRLLEFDPLEPPEPVDPTEPVPPEEQFVGCPNPWQVPLVEDGAFRFEVRAIDRAGNTDPTPAVHEFTLGVDVTPPDTQILDGPSGVSPVGVAAFTFTGTDNRTAAQFLEYECRIDSTDPTAWLECVNPAVYANLTPGSHTFEVRATDGGDNIDPTPATRTWTVGVPADCDAANITLVATEDAHVDEGFVVENFGAAEGLVVRSSAPGQDARALVRFALPEGGPACELTSATLRLNGDRDAGRVLTAAPLAGAWTESAVTWNTQPAVTAAAPATAASGAGYREWDVSAHVAAMLAGTAPDHGWLVSDAAEEGTGFEQTFISSEAVAEPPVPPQLVLRFDGTGIPAPGPPLPAAGTTTVTCGQVITQSTTLAGDVTGCLGEGLVIGAPDIVLDLNGFTVRSGLVVDPGQEEGIPAGIRNSGHTNVVVRNGTVENFGYGVQLTAGTTYNVVEDVTLRSNVIAGVELSDADNGRNGNTVRGNDLRLNGTGINVINGSENSVFTGNTLTGNLGLAMYLYEATGHLIEANTVSGLTGDPLLDSDGGIELESSSRNRIVGNTLSDTGDAAIHLREGSNDNDVSGNLVTRSSDSGIAIAASDGNDVVDNRVYTSGGAAVGVGDATGGSVVGNDLRFNPAGVGLDGSTGVLVQDNDVSGANGGGIAVQAGSGHRIIGNTANETGAEGISVEAENLDANGLPVNGVLIEGNTTNGNGASGVSVVGGGHTVTGNAAHHNLAFGISADDGTVDGGGNTASGNAEAVQCVGVVCGIGTPPPVGATDILRPDTVLVTTPANPSSNLSTAVFTFTGSDNATPPEALRFECRLDAPPDPPFEPEPPAPGEPVDIPSGEGWTECSSGVSYPFLPSGTHTFEVRAIDAVDLFDDTQAVFTWDVIASAPGADVVPPSTTLVSAPTDPSSDAVARFTFRGSDNATPGPNLTYECRLDGGAWAACVSPLTYPNLPLGPHTFEVRTVDAQGNADPTPATHTFTQLEPPPDIEPPDTVLEATPDATTVATAATFEFSATEENAVFECRLDTAAFAPCTSPAGYTGLAPGAHTFAVRAVDLAGNADGVPAAFDWTITDAPVEAAATCGQVITVSTRLTEDLLNCPEDGIVVGADAITIDLGGVTIDGSGIGAGVRNDGFDAVTITNGFVQEFVDGVALNPGTTRNIVSDITVQLAEQAGVTLTNADDGISGNTVRTSTFAGNGSGVLLQSGSQGSTVSGNVIAGSAGPGVQVLGSAGNRVEDNDVTGSSDAGFVVEGSPNTVLTGNSADGNSDAAIIVAAGSHGTRAQGNTVLESEAGIDVAESHDVELRENVLNGSSDNGITLEAADRATVVGNDLRFNGGGVEVGGSTDGRIEANDASESGMGISLGDGAFRFAITGNTANANDSEGIAVSGEAPAGSGNLIENNTASGNTADGIYIGAVSHMIRGNSADDNGGWGIYAAEGSVAGVNVDGGGNRALGNEGGGLFDPVTQTSEQCYNIRCDGGAPLPTDPVAPETVLAEGPPSPTTFTTATLTFTGSDNASSVTFQCRLDGGEFAPCTSPVTYSGLAVGEHSVTIRAVDFSGNADSSPVVHTWTIEAPDPFTPPVTSITGTPDITTVSTAATFTFAADEEGVTFQCRLDGGPLTACTSPAGYSGLAVGTHVFEVIGTDPQGNVEASPATFTWTVGPPPVAATVSCGQTLTVSTRLLNDLLDCNGDGLVVAADGITVDLDGHLVDGVGLGNGVLVTGDAVTVTNGTVAEFDFGVGVGTTTGVLVSGLTLSVNQEAGVALTGATGSVVRANTVTENRDGIAVLGGTTDAKLLGNAIGANPGAGVRVENSPDNRIDGNTIDGSSEAGVVVEGSTATAVVGNTLSGNSAGGVAVDLASHDSVVVDNTVTLSGSGGVTVTESDRVQVVANVIGQSGGSAISLELAADGLIRGNDARGNPGGIDLNQSTGHRIENNDTGASSGTGIALEGGSIGNEVIGNRSSANSGEGIYVGDPAASGTGNLIENNTANNNGGAGINVNAAVHTIRGNTVSGNDGWGIFAVPGNIDGGGNQASGNIEPAQCSGVVCAIAPPPGAPNTILVERPTDPTTSRNALFTFTGTDDTTTVGNLGFQCRIDSTDEADFVDCENPQEYFSLSPGDHVFEVRAVDAQEFVDPTPARWEWTYTALPAGVAPLAQIGLAPAAETPLLEAAFTFTANEPDVTFECSLDGASFGPCAFAVEYEFEETQVGPHTFAVRATDFEGNVGPPAVHDWTIIGVVTTITAGPAFEPGAPGEPANGGDTTDTTATFQFAANAADATFRCSLDLGPFVGCTSPLTYTGLAVGEHLLRIVATDPETGREELEPAEYEWTVITGTDVAPPQTQILSGPPTATPSDQATFSFTGSDNLTAPAGLEFACSLDGGEFLPCTSPWTYPNPDLPEPLDPGALHTFAVQAIDLEGNADPSPASLSWTFTGDTTAPVVSFVATPPAATGATTARFVFSANDPYPAFECALNGAPAEPCASPLDLTDLVPGPQVLAVRATDLAGNLGAATEFTWTVVGEPVTALAATPPVASTTSTATFAFTADQPGSTYLCSVDGGPFAPCAPPVTLTGLASGDHTFAVRSINSYGVVQTEPTVFAWTVTLPPPPVTTFSAQPAATTVDTTATFAFAADTPGAVFECALDLAAFAPCTSPVTVTGLAVGEHDFAVRATGAEGQVAAPVVVEWEILPPDTAAPDTTLASGPPASTTATEATVTFGATEAGSTFQCAVDGAAYVACTSPLTVTGLGVGNHEVQIRATDAAGNVDASPLLVAWTVTAPAPSCPTTPVTANAVADSWLLQDSPSQNYGTDSTLKVDSKSGANARALVRFGLPALPPGCTVTGATLRLNAASAVSGRTLQALPVTGGWTENTVTWATQPATGGPAATTTSGSGYRQWTVTAQVLAMYSGANNGFLIRDAAENAGGRLQGFRSREDSSNRPQLVITFGPGSAPPPTGPPPADTTAPDTVIGSGPAASGTATSATFTFSSTEGGSTFTCAVNAGTAVACTSPLQVTGLAPGSYTLAVRATDAAGNADPTPATYAWTVTGGTTPPPSGGSCTAAPVTVGADRDAWIEEKDPGKNYGSDSVLKVRAKSGEHSRALIRFALPAVPAGCQIVGAELRVHDGSPVAGRTIQALRVNGAWTEGGVTWANQPATTGTAATAATPSGSGTMTWNVTSMVQAMAAGTNHGFLLRDASTSGDAEQGFHAREKAPDQPPQLVITFGPAS